MRQHATLHTNACSGNVVSNCHFHTSRTDGADPAQWTLQHKSPKKDHFSDARIYHIAGICTLCRDPPKHARIRPFGKHIIVLQTWTSSTWARKRLTFGGQVNKFLRHRRILWQLVLWFICNYQLWNIRSGYDLIQLSCNHCKHHCLVKTEVKVVHSVFIAWTLGNVEHQLAGIWIYNSGRKRETHRNLELEILGVFFMH